jgi:hypothetical protein
LPTIAEKIFDTFKTGFTWDQANYCLNISSKEPVPIDINTDLLVDGVFVPLFPKIEKINV